MTRCSCPSPGYCPVKRTMVYPEDWIRCQSDAGDLTTQLFNRGIKIPGLRPDAAPPNPTKTAKGDCGPCEAAASKASHKSKQIAKWNPANFGPVLTNAQGKPAIGLKSVFAGGKVFLIGGGPSFKNVDHAKLRQPGIVTAAMNNVAAIFRPQLWFSVDQPRNFHEAIWRDPAVMKFTFDKFMRPGFKYQRADGIGFEDVGRVIDAPNAFGFAHVHGWNADTFLTQPWPTWGVNSAEEDPEKKNLHCTVMLPTLWLLYWLGFRTIYLLGSDFSMSIAEPYSFAENGHKVSGNNELYGWLSRRFAELKPHFREHGLTVLNCTEGSKLDVFDRLGLDAAIEAAREGWPEEIITKGHYRG